MVQQGNSRLNDIDEIFFSKELTDLDVGIINAWDVTNYRRQFDVGTIVSTCLYCRKRMSLLLPIELQQTFAGQNMRHHVVRTLPIFNVTFLDVVPCKPR
jgi:hypothetical protein